MTTFSSPSIASIPCGYHGRYLRMDVSTGAAQALPLEESLLREYLGGSGLGTAILLREGVAAADPLSAEAAVAFVFSPLVGSPLTTSAKFAVVSKSPLTNRLNDALASSGFALGGKRTGNDALVIVGCAPQWSVLLIDESGARLESADDLLGLSTTAAERALRARFGPAFSFAVIGPAGERGVRYATVSHDGRHAGRGGTGAVIGSKRLKAIGVSGSRHCSWSDPPALAALAKDISARSFGPATAKYRELGTAANLLVFNRLHALPTRNFQEGSFAEAVRLAPETLAIAREKTRSSCAACTIGCEHIYGLGGDKPGEKGVRLEYENLFALGPLCGIGDAEAVLSASRRCDELGIDTISAGGTIAFAMECVERGLLNAPWLRFGDGAALLRAIEEIGARRGLGDRLSHGSRRLALEIGHDSLDFAPQVKGLEMPGYEPRALQAMALGLAVGTRGADHNRSGAYEVDFSPEGDRRAPRPDAALRAIETEDKAALLDSLILCKFLRGLFPDLFAAGALMLRPTTGWDVTPEELRTTVRRIVAARKQFNILAGWTPAEDTLPARFLTTALPDDAGARLPAERLAAMVKSYNLARGWTADGYLPT